MNKKHSLVIAILLLALPQALAQPCTIVDSCETGAEPGDNVVSAAPDGVEEELEATSTQEFEEAGFASIDTVPATEICINEPLCEPSLFILAVNQREDFDGNNIDIALLSGETGGGPIDVDDIELPPAAQNLLEVATEPAGGDEIVICIKDPLTLAPVNGPIDVDGISLGVCQRITLSPDFEIASEEEAGAPTVLISGTPDIQGLYSFFVKIEDKVDGNEQVLYVRGQTSDGTITDLKLFTLRSALDNTEAYYMDALTDSLGNPGNYIVGYTGELISQDAFGVVIAGPAGSAAFIAPTLYNNPVANGAETFIETYIGSISEESPVRAFNVGQAETSGAVIITSLDPGTDKEPLLMKINPLTGAIECQANDPYTSTPTDEPNILTDILIPEAPVIIVGSINPQQTAQGIAGGQKPGNPPKAFFRVFDPETCQFTDKELVTSAPAFVNDLADIKNGVEAAFNVEVIELGITVELGVTDGTSFRTTKVPQHDPANEGLSAGQQNGDVYALSSGTAFAQGDFVLMRITPDPAGPANGLFPGPKLHLDETLGSDPTHLVASVVGPFAFYLAGGTSTPNPVADTIAIAQAPQDPEFSLSTLIIAVLLSLMVFALLIRKK